MKETEIIKYWGAENLTRRPRAIVDQLALPPSSKSFLAEVGLPVPQNDPLWVYEFDLHAPSRISQESSCLCISLKPRPICIIENEGGCVIMPSIEGDMQRFVNSTVEYLGAFLTVCQSHQKRLLASDGDTEQSRLIVASLREEMFEMDAMALRDENAYWAVVLEDLSYPLLTDEQLKNLE